MGADVGTVIEGASAPLAAHQRPGCVALPESFGDAEAADAAGGSYKEDGEWFFDHDQFLSWWYTK
ncbi:hypothetical protein [Pseudarthrobacter siccitolerans]